jgi:hypothetical protein
MKLFVCQWFYHISCLEHISFAVFAAHSYFATFLNECNFKAKIWTHRVRYIIMLKLKQFHCTPRRHLRGKEVQLLLILDLSTRWDEWSASRPGRALAPGKGPPVPIVQEAGWTSELVWTQRLEEKSFRFCRWSNFERPVVQPDNILTELPGSQIIMHIPKITKMTNIPIK